MEDNEKTLVGKLETLKHIHKVRSNLYKMIEELDERARNHDQSKLQSPEAEIYGEHTPELAKVSYGTPEYTALLEKVKPAIEHHYANNRHHPEFHKNGIDDMDLLDILEMLMDWKAATERNKNGNINKYIEVNMDRFKMSPQLATIMHNTIKRYF
jgi:hypothetical protein